jgi:hypothetical protein
VTAAPTAGLPTANDDDYNSRAREFQQIYRVLNVLANDKPRGSIEIYKIEVFSPYGLLILRDNNLAYLVDSYDGTEHTDTFR